MRQRPLVGWSCRKLSKQRHCSIKHLCPGDDRSVRGSQQWSAQEHYFNDGTRISHMDVCLQRDDVIRPRRCQEPRRNIGRWNNCLPRVDTTILTRLKHRLCVHPLTLTQTPGKSIPLHRIDRVRSRPMRMLCKLLLICFVDSCQAAEPANVSRALGDLSSNHGNNNVS